ncbi:MAG: transglutaminase domain-containing protein [Elusimicrobia bacterium]|nr:transglutaminase domain-containing protein [Elusimicrobiota bacterium]
MAKGVAADRSKDKQTASSPRWGRWFGALLFAAGAAAFARLETIVTLSSQNGMYMMGRFRLAEDPVDHPRLQLLRKREKLDGVIAPGKTQLEKFVLLRHWAHEQWKSAPTFRYPPWDAVEILDLARQKGNYGFCAQYAIVFLQAARSLGFHARYVDTGHFFTSIWNDEQQKWMAMDPTNDWHYERDGIGQSGRQLAEASWTGDMKGIEQVHYDGTRKQATPDDLKIFRNFAILLNNDQLTDPIMIAESGRKHRHVHLADWTQYPQVGRENVGYGAEFLAWHHAGNPAPQTDRHISDDPDDFRDRFNQTIITVAATRPERALAKLRLFAENAPEFQAFVIDDGLQTHETPQDEIFWELRPGLNRFTARVKTKSGWLGQQSSVTLYYKPNRLPKYRG